MSGRIQRHYGRREVEQVAGPGGYTARRVQPAGRNLSASEIERSVYAGALRDVALRDALAYLGTGGSGRMVKTFRRTWLTTVTGMAGRATDARREFDAIEWRAQEPDACMFEPV